jgi:hypothetical protein
MGEYKLRVFKNRVLRKISEPNRKEVPGDWVRLHNECLHVMYFLPNVIWLIKSRKLKWTNHVARMEETSVAYRVSVRKPGGKDNL